MKKLIISFILLLSLICLAPTATYARAGGASGGGGGSTSSGSFGGSTSTTTDRTTNNYYGRRGYYGPRSFLNNLVFAIFFIISAFLMIIRKKRDWLARRHERALSRTVTIDDATRERFEECFYQIEAAWTTNDLSLVAPLMTPHFPTAATTYFKSLSTPTQTQSAGKSHHHFRGTDPIGQSKRP